jgi:anti-anti-sigma factor
MHDTRFTVLVEHQDDVIVVHVGGELDLASAPDLEVALAGASGPIIVDCEHLEFVDASGIAVFARAARRNDDFSVRALSPFVRRVFEVLGVLDVVTTDDQTS